MSAGDVWVWTRSGDQTPQVMIVLCRSNMGETVSENLYILMALALSNKWARFLYLGTLPMHLARIITHTKMSERITVTYDLTQV